MYMYTIESLVEGLSQDGPENDFYLSLICKKQNKSSAHRKER